MNLTLRNTIMHLFVLAVLSPAVYGQTLVHYWNFNVSTDEAALLAPTQSILAGASILHIPGGTSAIQTTSNTGQGSKSPIRMLAMGMRPSHICG
ncbi:MAG: hypothetical protein IPH04_02770 [Saprospirales bacterium]|nr:hypothetical protein [Saprospirales bacterium]